MCDWKAKSQRISRRKEAVMARIIEFYVPAKFQRREKLIARSQKGKVILFCAEAKKPA
jgi:predicted RNA polymerase sigma factor